MGFQATVVIRLDAVSTIKENPKEFTENLCDALRGHVRHNEHNERNEISCGNHCNVAEIISVHHSGDSTLTLLGGGTGVELLELFSHNVTDIDFQLKSVEQTLRHLKNKRKEINDSIPKKPSK